MIKQFLKTILPASTRASLKRAAWRSVQRSLEPMGYVVSLKKDFYSPLSAVSDLKARAEWWNKPSTLKGIDYNIEKMENSLTDLLAHYLKEYTALPPFEELAKVGYGPGFTDVDGLTLYMMIRHTKPKRYIEVGSGLSTYYCSLAAEQNAKEGHPLEITCIEPYPYEKLYSIPSIRIIPKEVQCVEVSFFNQLQEEDIFFIDSSHMVKVGSDVPYLFLEVMPSLKVGVRIHIHDVPFPYNTPYPADEWIFKQIWPMLWNEAMMVQSFLCFNHNFNIEMSTPLIRYFDEPFLKKSIPFYQTIAENPRTFCSLWLKRTA